MIRSVEQESSIPRVTSAVGAFRTFEALESVWVHRRAIPAPTGVAITHLSSATFVAPARSKR